jgi:magnesium transporter
VAWYCIDDPKDPKLDELAAQFQLHPLHIEDCRSENERAKSEEMPNYLFVLVKYIHKSPEGEPCWSELCMFVGHDFFITVRDADLPADVVLDSARKANEGGGDARPSKLLYLILDTVVDSYFVNIDHIDDRIDDLQDAVLEAATPELLGQIFDEKRRLTGVRRVLVGMRENCTRLTSEHSAFIDADLGLFFRDISDHVYRQLDLVESLRDLLNNTLDVYLSSVANRTNQIMKVLTVLSTIALPAVVISSIFGMNVKGVPFLNVGYGFYAVAAMMVASTVGLLWMLKRFGWF